MKDLVQAALIAITQAFSDTRVHYCQVQVASLEGDRCALAGTVLDRETLAGVTRGLAARFPALTVDARAVRCLSGASNASLTVVTNVTGLHAQASFSSELLSQILNGTTAELLQVDQSDDRWAFVRLFDGYLGWAYRPYLTSSAGGATSAVASSAAAPSAVEPTHLVCEPVALLRSRPQADAGIVTRVLAGTAVAAGGSQEGWISLTLAGGLSGWLPQHELRALTALPRGGKAGRQQLVADAFRFVGVPYLWGGCTALGIDCAGFVQLLHRLAGLNRWAEAASLCPPASSAGGILCGGRGGGDLPRDADMQFDAGRPVQPPLQPGDLLFFGGGGPRKITHVGMSLGGWQMIHSSRSRNGVYRDDVQAVEHLRTSYAGARTFLDE